MKPFYSITIPKPCHENWTTMTPNEKGRFCNSCAKTVIDFTKMRTDEIQNILYENRNNSICGHIRQEQLDRINIQIPMASFSSNMNFHKMFLLALLMTMGTTLLNCTSSNDKVQKIESVEIIDKNDEISFTLGTPFYFVEDSIIETNCTIKNDTSSIHPKESNSINKQSLKTKGAIKYNPEIEKRETLTVEGEMITTVDTFVIGFIQVKNPPEFKNTPQHLSTTEKREYFSSEIAKFVKENFNLESASNLGLEGNQKIYTQFKIDTFGKIIELKVKAPHKQIEKETKRVLNQLPTFIPAKQGGKNVSIIYNLPIAFKIED